MRLPSLLPVAAIVTAFLLAPPALAQEAADDEPEPLYEQLRAAFKQPYFNVGLLLQAVADVQLDRGAPGNGFDVSRARLSVMGELDGGFSYFLNTELTAQPAVLDARLSYAISERLTLDAGLFKAPFSAEFLIPAPFDDFARRAQFVDALVPGRQIGAAVRGVAAEGLFHYQAGAFNGNGRQLAGNDNNALLYAGRFELRPALSLGGLAVGVNIAVSEDDFGGFSGTRALFGADARIETERLLLSAEYVRARLESEGGTVSEPLGYQLTAGYDLVPDRHRLLLRWDALHRHDLPGGDDNLLVVGYNAWPTQVAKIQVNYRVPTVDGGLSRQQLVAAFQLSF